MPTTSVTQVLTALELGRAKLKQARENGTVERRTPTQIWESNKKSLRGSINEKCWNCSNGSTMEITNCPVTLCGLWHVRPYQRKEES